MATSLSPNSQPSAAGAQLPDHASSVTAVAAEDLMAHYSLNDVLNDMRNRKLRSSFMHLIHELPTDVVPLRPRCPAGLLGEIARMPVNEDERQLVEFDEHALRAALTLKESTEAVKMPAWLDDEQPQGDDERRKRRKEKKKKKKRKKRKRTGDDGDDRADDEERKSKRKRR